jgi:hypothetical protein
MSTLETYEAHESVLAFIQKNGLAGPGTLVTDTLRLCRARMILEELGELAIAMHEYQALSDGAPDLDELFKLKIPIADGLADLLYVSQGLAIIMLPEPLRDSWDLVLTSTNYQTHLEDLMILSQWSVRVIDYILDPRRLRMALWKLHVAIARVAIQGYNLPFREVFREIQKSNMTKNLKGAKVGEKGNQVPDYKGPGYEPPDLARVLRLCVEGEYRSSTS